jgi:hypothetical protein
MSQWLETLRRRRLAVLGTSVVMVLGVSIAWSLFTPHADPFVQAIRKRGYPATLTELEAWYPAVPPAENAALIYTNAVGMLTNSDGPITNFMGKSWLPPIGQGLSADELRELKAVLAQNQVALRLIYSVPASARCRYPIRLQDGFTMLLPHLSKMKQAVSLLTAEGLMYATEGDSERATQSFLAAGRLADSVAEEPVTISQLVRYANWGIILTRLERALSLIPFTDSQLASLQQMAEAAERPRAAVRGWAGEQAGGLSVFLERKSRDMAFWDNQNQRNRIESLALAAGLTLFRISGLMTKDKAFYCDTMAKHLAAVELPFPARFTAGKQLEITTNVPGRFLVFSRMLVPSLARIHLREVDQAALARVAAAALAIERFRLAHTNALPENLQQLIPNYCKTIPTDPIDGQPLRYKTQGPNYVVYSIGNDAQDDGGVTWESAYLKVPQDVVFMVKHPIAPH